MTSKVDSKVASNLNITQNRIVAMSALSSIILLPPVRMLIRLYTLCNRSQDFEQNFSHA